MRALKLYKADSLSTLHIKKITDNCRIIPFLLLCCLASIHIQASTVKDLAINVILTENGDARITEVWDIDLDNDDAKTEWYVRHNNISPMEIKDLRVSGFIPGKGEGQQFLSTGEWDTEASREEKSGRCGINNGNEICFGFGDWGRHKYTISYTLTKLVKDYDSNDGFNHCFVEMDCDIEKCRVTITGDKDMTLNKDNTKMWAFGYHGNIVWQNGSIVASTEKEMEGGDKMIVMLEFSNDTFMPAYKSSKKWTDVKDKAMEGSDYDDSDTPWYMILLYLAIIIVAIILAILILPALGYGLFVVVGALLVLLWWVISLEPLRKKNKRKKLGISNDRYYRDVKPEWKLAENGNMMESLSLSPQLFQDNTEKVIGAYLLRLLKDGKITTTEIKYKENKVRKTATCIKILEPYKERVPKGNSDTDMEKTLLRYLTDAAGQDAILQPKEFERWTKKHGQNTASFIRRLKSPASEEYIRENAADLYGMKNFLEDFTLMNERETTDMKLWDEYIVYAHLFGIAEKVMKEMKAISPEFIDTSALASTVSAVNISYINEWTQEIEKAGNIKQSSKRSKGSGRDDGEGGSSSYDGGGGYSGGGGGGGR